MTNPLCDPETGACLMPDVLADETAVGPRDATIYYVGDPMCSWCWGMSPETGKLAQFASENGLGFRVVMGGLRAGGGDPWNAQFRSFLRQEWQQIQGATGQPFSFKLLEKDFFNYDTEPACRAVAAVRMMTADEALTLRFFSKVQRKFYVDGEDTKTAEFYRSICEDLAISFDAFAAAFQSSEAQQEVRAHFRLARDLGARGFPSVIAKVDGKLHGLSTGYRKFEPLRDQLTQLLA